MAEEDYRIHSSWHQADRGKYKGNAFASLRRVSSIQINQGRITKRSKWNNVRGRLGGYEEDGDVQYANQSHQRRGQFRGGRGNRGRGGMQSLGGRHVGNWYQIRITLGARYSHDVILSKLVGHVGPDKFFPICYQIHGEDAVFYVDKFQDAQLLLSCTRKIKLDDGSLMLIKIRPGQPPISVVNDDMKEKMKTAMAKRYIAVHKALDLTRFSRDPEFIEGFYCSLSRPIILAAALKIITENIPDLMALKLTGNGIIEFEAAAPFIKNMKALKILHLNENNIGNMYQLESFKSLDISELLIEKNPIVNKYSDKSHFVSEIRKRFPRLTKLDNTELTPVVAFDVGDETKYPTSQAAFVCHAEGRDFVKVFLSQYFQIYDSDNRNSLEQAYEQNATFSLTIPRAPPVSGPRLNAYVGDSRNLLRISDFRRRRSALFRGRSNIVDHLNRLPRSEHDLLSFAVDLTLFTPVLINLSVTGVFRERGTGSSSNWPLRYFSRTFLIVPVGTGFCIVNEVLYITNATPEQAEVAFKTEPPKPVAAASPVAALPAPALDQSVQLQMMQAVSEQTGMNIEWSKKCLEETSWDFQRAIATFTDFQSRGVIPAEAFIKV